LIGLVFDTEYMMVGGLKVRRHQN